MALRLRPATPEDKRARDLLTHAAWGQRLTVEQYLEREERLRAHPWSVAAMQTWLLEEGSEVLASCETFRSPSVNRGEDGVSFAIASVFTEERLRGRGLATALMDLLCARINAEPRAQAVILFSDVGERQYARSGFVARPAIDRVFAAEKGTPSGEVEALVQEASLPAALARIAPPGDAFAFRPTVDQLDWHLERERIYAALLHRERPLAIGARAGGSTLLWAANFKEERLQTLLLGAARPEEVAALFRCARAVAHATGLAEVRHWEEPLPFPWPASSEGVLVPRDGGIPMLRPLDPAVRPADWNHVPRALWV